MGMLSRGRAALVHLYSVLRQRKTDIEIEEEFRFHLEMTVQENVRNGLSAEEAQNAAARRFGSVSQVREAGRGIRRGYTLDVLLQDLRYSFRIFAEQPGLFITVALTMMLGIGANTAIFSVVHSVLLKPLPYDHPEQLALIWSNFQKTGASKAPAAPAQVKEMRENCRLFQDVAGIWVGGGTFTGEDQPEQVKVGSVTTNFLSLLGIRPTLGRLFLPEDDASETDSIILSYGIWMRRFGGDANIIGRQVRYGNGARTVVGVLPADFSLSFPPESNVPSDIQAWIPFWNGVYSDRSTYYIRLLGRMRPGVTVEQAQADADRMAGLLREHFTEYNAENLQLEVIQLHKDLVSDIKPALVALFAGAALVLLICCFNVSNLLLMRASGRRKEIAVRTALGASRLRIARQLVSESLLICGLGGGLGLGLGILGLRFLLRIRPDSLSRVKTVDLDLPVLAFVVAISVAAGLFSGLAPLVETRKLDLTESLKEGGRSASGLVRHRLRALLIVTEIALGTVLLVGAGLMARTLLALHSVSPGFNPAHVLTFEMNPRGDHRIDTVAHYEEAFSTIPGVESVGAISHLPLGDYPNWYSPYSREGVTADDQNHLLADYRAITPGFFHSVGARLVEGRDFNRMDSATTRDVVIVDDMLAAQTWPGQTAIGKKLNVELYGRDDGGFGYHWADVIGVVGHIKTHSLMRALRGEIYIPYPQSPREHLSFVVRTSGEPLALTAAVRAEVSKIDKSQAIANLRPMDKYVADAMSPVNFTALLAGIFAFLALVLATLGVYGVVSFSANQRKQEIGVRVALGATRSDISRLVIKEGVLLSAIGLVLGLAGSIALSGYLRSFLFGVQALDPLTYIAILVLIPLATLLACWRPAYRAAAGNPVEALRR
jgi:predicted permease